MAVGPLLLREPLGEATVAVGPLPLREPLGEATVAVGRRTDLRLAAAWKRGDGEASDTEAQSSLQQCSFAVVVETPVQL